MSVEVADKASALSAAQNSAITTMSSSHRVKVIVDNPSSKPDLQTEVHDCVDTPNTICVGVSPKLRYTWTEIGIDTGISSANFQQIGRAGNLDFKEGRWDDGIKSIISRAEVLTRKETSTPTGVVVQEHKTVVDHGVPTWPFAIGFGVVAAAGAGLYYVAYRQQKKTARILEDKQREVAELAARNVREQKWADEIDKRVGGIPSIGRPPSPPPSPLVAKLQQPRPVSPAVVAPVPAKVRAVHPVKIDPPLPRKHTPKKPAPVTVVQTDDGFVTGFALGQATAAPLPPPREPTPAPVRSSFSSSSSSDDDDSRRSSSSSSSSFFDSFSGGGGGGGFDGGGGFSGGGGGGDF